VLLYLLKGEELCSPLHLRGELHLASLPWLLCQ
jgi:hypothetical protein